MASIQIKGEGPGWQVCGMKDQVAHWHYSRLADTCVSQQVLESCEGKLTGRLCFPSGET